MQPTSPELVGSSKAACFRHGVELQPPNRNESDWGDVPKTPLTLILSPLRYLFSGSGCRAATTPPRAAAERLARTAPFAGSLCAAGRGATRRSATSSTRVNKYRLSSLRIPGALPPSRRAFVSASLRRDRAEAGGEGGKAPLRRAGGQSPIYGQPEKRARNV